MKGGREGDGGGGGRHMCKCTSNAFSRIVERFPLGV